MTTQELYLKRYQQGLTIETEYADAMFDGDFRTRFRTLFPHLLDATIEELQTIHATDNLARALRAMMDDTDFHVYLFLSERNA